MFRFDGFSIDFPRKHTSSVILAVRETVSASLF